MASTSVKPRSTSRFSSQQTRDQLEVPHHQLSYGAADCGELLVALGRVAQIASLTDDPPGIDELADFPADRLLRDLNGVCD